MQSHARYQGLPKDGYSAWMANMLKGIPVVTDFDYLKRREEVWAKRKLIFTGPIDEYFGFKLGRLEYRAQRREHDWKHFKVATPEFPCSQINNPQYENGAHIRTIEWRHLMPNVDWICGTLLTRETPYSPTDPDAYEYPFPDEANARLYAAYRELALAETGTIFGGRLGTYRYFDMDAAIGAALHLADKLLKD